MNTPSSSELDVLMARLADGDRSAFTPVFEALWDPVVRVCQAALQHEEDAADAAQQAMEKILVRASEYDASRPALPWAVAIAAWECRTVRKQRSRRRESPEAAAPDVGTADSEATIAERELVSAAVTALGLLTDVDREALVATYWETEA
ncbi:MAG: sigma-70 family RNA polymerase sigma factor, partial [Myxococcales bacterium]|nr:sigma-70 family RNA polymerase sigma factor [Myxococcales bacterium]